MRELGSPFRGFRKKKRVGVTAAFSLVLTGLSSDSLGSYGLLGGHAGVGFTITPDNGTHTVKWSNSANPDDPATYGTGAAPTDYTAADGSIVYLHVTDAGQTVTRSMGVRRAPGSAGSIGAQTWIVDDESGTIAGAATGAGLTFSYALTGVPASVTVNAGTGLITKSLPFGTVGASGSGTGTLTATDQYGRNYLATFAWSYALRTAAVAANGLGPFNYTVDDQVVNQNAVGDFTANGNTLGYVISGLPAGLVDDLDGSWSGIATTNGQSGNITVTATDEYGRTAVSTIAFTTAWRAQATAANGFGPYAWTVDDDVLNIDFKTDFTANGNTLGYVITGRPTGVTDDGDGTISGFPTANGQSGNILVTATDEYGRQTVSTVSFTTAWRAQATAANGFGPFSWIVDDTTVNIDFKTDFTVNGNSLGYVITGLPSGVVDDLDGTISGIPTTNGQSGSVTVTATDEYGRITTSVASYSTAWRTQAVGGVDLDLSFIEDAAIASTNLVQNWTTNGNSLSFVSISPALPTGLSINGAGVMTGTPTTPTQDVAYTLTMQDEYGRQTADTFTLEITSAGSADWSGGGDWSAGGDWSSIAA